MQNYQTHVYENVLGVRPSQVRRITTTIADGLAQITAEPRQNAIRGVIVQELW